MNNEKLVWYVPVNWEMRGTALVVADTLEEAINFVKEKYTDDVLPVQSEYVFGSFEVEDIPIEDMRKYFNMGQEDA